MALNDKNIVALRKEFRGHDGWIYSVELNYHVCSDEYSGTFKHYTVRTKRMICEGKWSTMTGASCRKIESAVTTFLSDEHKLRTGKCNHSSIIRENNERARIKAGISRHRWHAA